MNVVVMGASNKPDRYSYKAVMLLKQKGHNVFPVHQRVQDIEGIKVYPSIKDVREPIDTVSMYVAKDISDGLTEEILAQKPRRIIFNPGAENPSFEATARQRGVIPVNACTLVLLNTNQF